MQVLITGGSGFLGRALTQALRKDGHQVTWVSRRALDEDQAAVMTYEQLKTSRQVFDIIVNLAGAGIADKRWSEARKQTLLKSRLMPTQAVLDYLAQAAQLPKLLLSGSAIGWYGVNPEPVNESSPAHDVFTHQLCAQWEQLARTANDLGVPTTLLRTGVVIAPNGSMIAKLKLPFSLGLGGKLGNGAQWISWISLADWVRAVLFIIEKQQPESSPTAIYNLTAPNPVTNAALTEAVGEWLNRPTFFHQPRAAVELLFGEMSVLLLGSQQVVPQALMDAGFTFQHNNIAAALNQ